MAKMRNNKGFVIFETIIVISILAISLITLYSSYSLILTKTTTKSNYDNTEYIYKTYYVAKEYEKKGYNYTLNVDASRDLNSVVKNNFKVEKVYFMKMSNDIVNDSNALLQFDGSTIKYLRSLSDYNDANKDDTRIIVKYKVDNVSIFASLNYTKLLSL